MLRHVRKYPLAVLLEQPLTFKLSPKQLKASLQTTFATRADRLHRQTELPPTGQFRSCRDNHLHAILNWLSKLPDRHKAANAAGIVLQVEEDILPLVHLEACHLPLNTDTRKGAIKHLIGKCNEIT